MTETPAEKVTDFRHRLYALLEDSIDSYGYELVHLELVGRDKSRILRLYIDAPGGVTLDDCASVSQQVSRLLDVEDPIDGGYSLEVSSPGIERPLAKRQHFRQVIGERIEVSTYVKCEGRKKIMGQLLAVTDQALKVKTEGTTIIIAMNNIRRARLKPNLSEMI